MSVYGNVTELSQAREGRFTVTVYKMDEDDILLYRITPGVQLSDGQFTLWFPDFQAPKCEVFTTAVSLYEGPTGGTTLLREYFQPQVRALASYLDGIETGAYFT